MSMPSLLVNQQAQSEGAKNCVGRRAASNTKWKASFGLPARNIDFYFHSLLAGRKQKAANERG